MNAEGILIVYTKSTDLMAIAIYHSHELFLLISGRNALNLFNWFDLLVDSYEHGNHGAVWLNIQGKLKETIIQLST